MLNLLLNKFYRSKSKKALFIVAVVLMPLMIGIAIFFTGKATTIYTIAFVSDESVNFPDNPMVQIEIVDTRPNNSALALGKYTGIVQKKADGNYDVTTYKSKEVKEIIESFFITGQQKINDQEEQRGVGANILGFVLMIILMQGVALTTFYPEDRNNSIFRRILSSPVSNRQYLTAQGIFTYICLYVPTYAAIVFTNVIFGADIGFGFGTLAILIGIMTALATAFSLFMASVMDKNISLATSGIAIITCILAGCFFNFDGSIGLLETISSILPQKAFMTLIQGIENGAAYKEVDGQLIHIFAWAIAFWLVGIAVTKSRLKRGIY